MTKSLDDFGVEFLFGSNYAVRATVSLWSLRNDGEWGHSVALSATSSDSARIARHLASDERLGKLIPRKVDPINHSYTGGLLTKLKVLGEQLFGRTLFLDADTLVVAPIADVFQCEESLCLTQFADWTVQHPDVQCKFHQWLDLAPERVERVLQANGPAVNTGVFVHTAKDPQLTLWQKLAYHGADNDVPDEMAAQLLLPEFDDCQLLDEQWNFSPKYGRDLENAKVLHFHSGLHRQASSCSKQWWEMLRQVWEMNIGCIQSWGPTLNDPDLLQAGYCHAGKC